VAITGASHPFSLRQLQYALAVADELSFHRAATRCGVSQPSLSAQLAELETNLGVRFFERDRRRVLVSKAGKPLLEQARRIVLAADDLVQVAKESVDPFVGKFTLGVIPTVSPYLLPKIAPVLREHFPRLALTWIEDKTAVLAHALAEGRLDGAVVALEAELGPVDHAVIAKDQFVLATPREHPLSQGTGGVARRDLAGEDVLLLDEGHCLREQALEYCSRTRAHELEFRATSLPTLVQMVAGGAGVTLLPSLAVEAEAARAQLSLRPFEAPAPERTIALIFRRHSPLAASMTTLAKVMRDAYPSRKVRVRR